MFTLWKDVERECVQNQKYPGLSLCKYLLHDIVELTNLRPSYVVVTHVALVYAVPLLISCQAMRCVVTMTR